MQLESIQFRSSGFLSTATTISSDVQFPSYVGGWFLWMLMQIKNLVLIKTFQNAC